MGNLLASAPRPLLDNYLQFLGAFRGTMTERAGSVVVESDRSEFTMLCPVDTAARETLDVFDGSVLSLPWIPWVEEALAGSARRRIAEIVFMSRPVSTPSAETAGVRVAGSTKDVEDFSLVQARGFIDDDEEFTDWFPWLRSANLRNEGRGDCQFLIADADGRPAAVTMVLDSGSAFGIYAVATRPEHRRRGLATTLLGASEAIAAGRGHRDVGLQVYAGTYAHGFYDRQGFTEEYRVGIWR